MVAVNSCPLPLHKCWQSSDEFVQSLLLFITTNDLFRNLCGGVHVLDFLVREPDLYSFVLPAQWRDWVESVDIHDLLHLLLREDLSNFQDEKLPNNTCSWRGYSRPPQDLLQYISTVRNHSLVRDFSPVKSDITPLPRHISVGMKPKKVHEVRNFAAYVDGLSTSISESMNTPLSVIDFGSGQNYLGRTLACPPYNKDVIAIEQRHHNVEGAKGMDVHARLAKKEKIMRNKKEYKRQLALRNGIETSSTQTSGTGSIDTESQLATESETHTPRDESISEVSLTAEEPANGEINGNKGSMAYIEHALESGHLEHILHTTRSNPSSDNTNNTTPNSLVVSIHSCGNLTHHGLRSISLNPSIHAVAMIGCCYNLLTERLGPTTYKHPQLRPKHPRLEATSSTYDPHGFPMSQRFEDFQFTTTPTTTTNSTEPQRGVRLNITARMMAVQAPYNWGQADSELFFTRHFYRALLQRILLDRGVVKQAISSDQVDLVDGNSLSGKDTEGTPLIIGALPKSAFVDFPTYVKAALEKLTTKNADIEEGRMIARATADLLADDGVVVRRYESEYAFRRKHLAVIWSLMAFSASVVESAIVVDRWLWLGEQSEVKTAWVEAVFDYKQSPRNLCVVGVKDVRDVP